VRSSMTDIACVAAKVSKEQYEGERRFEYRYEICKGAYTKVGALRELGTRKSQAWMRTLSSV
jgi:hypothetical protein